MIQTNSHAMTELLQELGDVVDRVCATVMSADNEPVIPDSFEEATDNFYDIHQIHIKLQEAAKSVSSVRTSLMQILSPAMAAKGVKTLIGPNGSTVTSQPSIYHKITDLIAFREWVEFEAIDNPEIKEQLLIIKPRDGTVKEPGLRQLVSTEVKRARKELREPLLPDGVSYSEPPKLVIRHPKNPSKESGGIEDKAVSILRKLRDITADIQDDQ